MGWQVCPPASRRRSRKTHNRGNGLSDGPACRCDDRQPICETHCGPKNSNAPAAAARPRGADPLAGSAVRATAPAHPDRQAEAEFPRHRDEVLGRPGRRVAPDGSVRLREAHQRGLSRNAARHRHLRLRHAAQAVQAGIVKHLVVGYSPSIVLASRGIPRPPFAASPNPRRRNRFQPVALRCQPSAAAESLAAGRAGRLRDNPDGLAKPQPSAGVVLLRQVIADYLAATRGIMASPEQVVIVSGDGTLAVWWRIFSSAAATVSSSNRRAIRMSPTSSRRVMPT